MGRIETSRNSIKNRIHMNVAHGRKGVFLRFAALFLWIGFFGGLFCILPVHAMEETQESYPVFITFGGDISEEGDWGYYYAGEEATSGITVSDNIVKAGETSCIKLEFEQPVKNVWYFAPVIAAENIGALDYELELLIDGVEVPVDWQQGPAWKYEATGNYTAKEAVRLGGGYDEWGTKFISEPSGFTSIEYIIKVRSIQLLTEEDRDENGDAFAGSASGNKPSDNSVSSAAVSGNVSEDHTASANQPTVSGDRKNGEEKPDEKQEKQFTDLQTSSPAQDDKQEEDNGGFMKTGMLIAGIILAVCLLVAFAKVIFDKWQRHKRRKARLAREKKKNRKDNGNL